MDKSRINELLQERGLTMQDLAKAMNISYQALHVSSSANSTLSRLKEIVSILFVNMVELFVHRRTSFAILSAVLYWGAKNAEKRKEPENEKKLYLHEERTWKMADGYSQVHSYSCGYILNLHRVERRVILDRCFSRYRCYAV